MKYLIFTLLILGSERISFAQMLWHVPDTNGWSIQNVAISANGEACIVNTGKDYRSFHAEDGALIKTYGAIKGEGCAISPDASMVAIAADSGKIKIEYTYTGNEIFDLRVLGANDSISVQSIDWSRDGKYIVAGYSDTVVRLWSVTSHDTLWSNSATSLAWPSYDTLSTLVVDFSPSTQFIAVKRYGFSTAIVYSLAGQEVKYVDFAGEYGPLPFSPDGHRYWRADSYEYDLLDSSYKKNAYIDGGDGPLAYVSTDRIIYIQEPSVLWIGIDEFAPYHTLAQFVSSDTLMNTLAVSGDYRYALTGSELGALTMWDISDYAAVNSSKEQAFTLGAFGENSRITVDIPNGEGGKIFVYRSDGRCYFSEETKAGESSITTGTLPFGDYFVIFQPNDGARSITKVSIFQ